MSEAIPLFGTRDRRPLAEKLRPSGWEEFCGIENLDPSIIKRLRSGAGVPPSIVLWGPPGSGKTTFARLLKSTYPQMKFVELSAVLSGVKEVREVCENSKKTPTILFVDEIHRFNKAQQDAFLPYVERGDVAIVGATTENPSFYLTQALLSRVRVIVLPPLSDGALQKVFLRAEGEYEISVEPLGKNLFINFAGGDARKLLNIFEAFVQSRYLGEKRSFSKNDIEEFLKDPNTIYYDRSGDEHYNTVSAFIKSLRGSDPDAALFWGFRMIEAGDDPRFVIRRMIIFASEDIGNADPRALMLAVATAEAFDRVGLPEGKIPIAQCITYLATAPKSNRSYIAMHKAIDASKTNPNATIPLHLRNAPTGLMKALDYGKDYVYPHDTEDAFARGVRYLPEKVEGSFYDPSNRGYESKISELVRNRKSAGENEA